MKVGARIVAGQTGEDMLLNTDVLFETLLDENAIAGVELFHRRLFYGNLCNDSMVGPLTATMSSQIPEEVINELKSKPGWPIRLPETQKVEFPSELSNTELASEGSTSFTTAATTTDSWMNDQKVVKIFERFSVSFERWLVYHPKKFVLNPFEDAHVKIIGRQCATEEGALLLVHMLAHRWLNEPPLSKQS
jgi:hypothetical protein